MGWLIAAGVLILLTVLPVGISAVYDSHGPVARLIVDRYGLRSIPPKGKRKKTSRFRKRKNPNLPLQKPKPKRKKAAASQISCPFWMRYSPF